MTRWGGGKSFSYAERGGGGGGTKSFRVVFIICASFSPMKRGRGGGKSFSYAEGGGAQTVLGYRSFYNRSMR